MKTKAAEQCSQQHNSDDGLTVEQALQVHAGWNAAMCGLPFTQSNGQYWTEGFVNFHWLKGGPGRSWLRH